MAHLTALVPRAAVVNLNRLRLSYPGTSRPPDDLRTLAFQTWVHVER